MIDLRKKYPMFAMVLFALLFLIGCGTNGKLEPLQSLDSDAHQIEIFTPGGSFNPGDNRVAVGVTRNGQPLDLEEGRLWLHMPEMPNMPRMDTETVLTLHENRLEGNIYFEMGGGWNGEIEVVISDGQFIDAPVRVQVR